MNKQVKLRTKKRIGYLTLVRACSNHSSREGDRGLAICNHTLREGCSDTSNLHVVDADVHHHFVIAGPTPLNTQLLEDAHGEAPMKDGRETDPHGAHMVEVVNVRRRREDCPSSLEHVLDDSHSVIDRVPRRHVRAYIEACSAMNEEPIDAYIHCSRNERHCDHCRTLQSIEMKIAENDHHKAETVRYKLDSSLSRYFSTAIIPYLPEISRLGEVGMTRTLRSQVIWTILIQTTSQEEGSQ